MTKTLTTSGHKIDRNQAFQMILRKLNLRLLAFRKSLSINRLEDNTMCTKTANSQHMLVLALAMLSVWFLLFYCSPSHSNMNYFVLLARWRRLNEKLACCNLYLLVIIFQFTYLACWRDLIYEPYTFGTIVPMLYKSPYRHHTSFKVACSIRDDISSVIRPRDSIN